MMKMSNTKSSEFLYCNKVLQFLKNTKGDSLYYLNIDQRLNIRCNLYYFPKKILKSQLKLINIINKWLMQHSAV